MTWSTVSYGQDRRGSSMGSLGEEEASALPTPVPIKGMLPAIFQTLDPNLIAFTEALDEVMAPIWLSIDNFSSFVDPDLAPVDFVAMLATWVGVVIDDNWADDQKRRLVRRAVELYRRRGTSQGLSDLVRAYAGAEPEISESGGTSWSNDPGGPLPGSPVPAVRVKVDAPGSTSKADKARLLRIVAEAVPAHVAVTVEIAGEGDEAKSSGSSRSPREKKSAKKAGDR